MAYQTSTTKVEPPPLTVPPPQVQRFSIRLPKSNKKKYSVMRFNAGLKVDFKEWKQVKMERENNMKDFRGAEEDMPTFGAGSEFGRAAREEARRKRFGINTRKYKSENQPWILKTNGKNGKKFRGVKEGGVNDNAAYYIFSHTADGSIEAYPLHEWYKFQSVQRYKTLSAEEAEEEFSKRDKVMNYFSLMLKKRLKNDEENTEDAELVDVEKGKKPSKAKAKDLKISEMDEWIDSDDESDDSGSDDKENRVKSDDEDDAKKKKKKGKDLKKKKRKNASDDEAFEESDDGDEEGRERDYISDSSASESELEEQKEIKSVAEERGLRGLLSSEDEDETEENKDKKSEEDKSGDEKGKEKDDKGKDKSGKGDEKDKAKKKTNQKGNSDPSSEFESGEKNKTKDDKNSTHDNHKPSTAGPSRKRTLNSPSDISQTKKSKLQNNYTPSSYIPGSSESGITEDAVRRYLMRKPMTTTDLLQKFKSKKTGLSSEKIVTIMTKILKNINPTSQKIKGKMYFSL